MDSVDRRAVTPSKSRLGRTFAKVLHIRAVTGVAPVDGIQKTESHVSGDSPVDEIQKTKSHEIGVVDPVDGIRKTKSDVKVKYNNSMSNRSRSSDNSDEKHRHRVATEAVLAKLFASVSTVKAAYAQMQFAQSPYDGDGIQAADQMVVSELKILSDLKHSYLKKQFKESSEITLQLAELQEQKSLLITYEVMGKKLDSQLKLKNSEILFLKEKLEETKSENKLLEKQLNSSGLLSVPDNLNISGLNPNHFVSAVRQTIKSVRQFVRLMMNEMELTGWDLETAARVIEPDICSWNESHRCFALESFVCREMFDGFNFPHFSPPNKSSTEQQQNRQRLFFTRFTELKSIRTREYLVKNPKSTFARFCSSKYLRLVHPKMEFSLLGNTNQRNLVSSGEFPETNFFAAFSEMAKRVWLLHCLAFSFDPEGSIFQVGKRCRFSEVYMESVCDESFLSSDGKTKTEPVVAFTVVPGFRIGKTVIQCQVYLS